MADDIKNVLLMAKVIIGESEYMIIHIKTAKQPETTRKFKNKKDAGDWEQILTKLQTKKGILPQFITLGLPIVPNPSQPNQFSIQQIQLNPFNEETSVYIANELDQNALRKDFVNSKLDDEEKTWL